jgi:site-specific recombinase XerD
MATVNFYLKQPDLSGKSLVSLYFRFVENKQKKQVVFSTNESVIPKFWEKKTQRVKRSLTGYADINDNLDKLEEDVKEIYRKFCNAKIRKSLTPDLIKEQLNHVNGRKETPTSFSFLSFIEFYIKQVETTKKESTLKGYRNTLRHLKEFIGKKSFDFENVTLDFYNDFTEYLIKTKGFSTNTIGKQIKNTKVFLNEATERGINTKLDYKSKRFKVVSEEADTIYLSENEIQKLYELDLSENSRLEKVRDLFIVGCYTGLRFSDFSQISSENMRNGNIQIRTQKTDDTVVIPIHGIVAEILKKYKKHFQNSLPPALTNQKMNEYLKEVAKLGGLDEKIQVTKNKGSLRMTSTFNKHELVSTHTARRSFATNLYLADFPAISIMKITGHKTERAFLKYIKVTPEQVANKLKLFWSERMQLKKVS